MSECLYTNPMFFDNRRACRVLALDDFDHVFVVELLPDHSSRGCHFSLYSGSE